MLESFDSCKQVILHTGRYGLDCLLARELPNLTLLKDVCPLYLFFRQILSSPPCNPTRGERHRRQDDGDELIWDRRRSRGSNWFGRDSGAVEFQQSLSANGGGGGKYRGGVSAGREFPIETDLLYFLNLSRIIVHNRRESGAKNGETSDMMR